MAGEPYALSHCVFPWLSHLKKGLRFKGQTTPVPCDGGLSPSKPHTRLQGPAVHGRNDRDRPWMDEAYRISKSPSHKAACGTMSCRSLPLSAWSTHLASHCEPEPPDSPLPPPSLAAERSSYGRYKAFPAMNRMTIESRNRL
jgi:hypothetical protein